MPNQAQPWNAAPAGYEASIEPTAPPVGDYQTIGFPRALGDRLADRAATPLAGIVYRASDPSGPADQQWQTITVTIAHHTILATATTDPFVPREWVWQLTVDGRPVRYEMTHGRPLAEVLTDAAWHAIRTSVDESRKR
jgi:hypothetical protein